VLGIVAADRGALLDLGDRGGDGLAHLERHDLAEAPPVLLEDLGDAPHLHGAGGEVDFSPRTEGPFGERERRLDLGFPGLGKALQQFAVGGIHGCDGHIELLFPALNPIAFAHALARVSGRASRGVGSRAARAARRQKARPIEPPSSDSGDGSVRE
jgi:hypothetical protein